MHAIRHAIAKPKIKFVHIPLQMMLADVVIGANNSPLEYPEVTFSGVAMGADTFNFRRLRIFALSVIHRLMALKGFADWPIEIRAIGHQVSVLRNVLHDNRLDVVKVNIRHMEGLGFSFTRYKRKNLVAMAATRNTAADRIVRR